MYLKTLLLALALSFTLLACSAKKEGRRPFQKISEHHGKRKVKVTRYWKPKQLNNEDLIHSLSAKGYKFSKHSISSHRRSQRTSPSRKSKNEQVHFHGRYLESRGQTTSKTTGRAFLRSSLSVTTNQTVATNQLPASNPPTTSNTSRTTAPNGILDVGKILVESVPEPCNGVLLDPSIVLTSASCLYANKTSPKHENMTFVLNGISKKIEKVFGNPEWRQTGERKANFALFKLAQPMTGTRASHLTQLTWSPYALEDIGESFLASPAKISCKTASKKALTTDAIRHVKDNIITLNCNQVGQRSSGSPFYRLIGGNPVIYGIYFGHCTSGSLDRKMTGACGARISKKLFEFFCEIAGGENIKLPDCDSQILQLLDPYFPTVITNDESYDAVSSRAENRKGAVFVYLSSSSVQYQQLVKDIEAIQRIKTVYDQFQLATVDINVVSFAVKFAPYIEYRTIGEAIYFTYNDEYHFERFRNFMKEFSRVGAPPLGSLSKSPREFSSAKFFDGKYVRNVHSIGDEGFQGTKFRKLQCDPEAYEIADVERKCNCLPTRIGNGETGNCQDRKLAVYANCRYDVLGATENKYGLKFDQVVAIANDPTWCEDVFAFLINEAESVTVAGEALTVDECADEMRNVVECPKEPSVKSPLKRRFGHHSKNFRSLKTSRHPVGDNGRIHDNYLNPFFDVTRIETQASGAHSYLIRQNFNSVGTNGFSTLFQGDRRTPEYSTFKLDHNWLRLLNNGSMDIRAAVSNKWYSNIDLGTTHNGDARKRNAFPEYTFFNIGVWKSFKEKIVNYAKHRCFNYSDNSEIYLVSGLSDYEHVGRGIAARTSPTAYSPSSLAGRRSNINIPESIWTIGCCSWKEDDDTPHGQSLSVWANNVRYQPTDEIQLSLEKLVTQIYPASPGFNFFPKNPECTKSASHTIL